MLSPVDLRVCQPLLLRLEQEAGGGTEGEMWAQHSEGGHTLAQGGVDLFLSVQSKKPLGHD